MLVEHLRNDQQLFPPSRWHCKMFLFSSFANFEALCFGAGPGAEIDFSCFINLVLTHVTSLIDSKSEVRRERSEEVAKCRKKIRS